MAAINLNGKSGRVPSFLVVGTAKAGTTSLAAYLSQHPEIEIPQKETFYFNATEFRDICLPYPLQRQAPEIISSEAQYRKLFSSNGARVLGEIGTGYLYHHKSSIPLIKRMLGRGVKVMILLRNPIDRAYSAYMHFRKDCFEEIPFEEALEMEYYRKQQRWDFMWHYTSLGLYYEQVKAYMEAFDDVEVLYFDDLKADPNAFMNGVYSSLGVSPINGNFQRVKNPSGEARIKWVQELITHENPVKTLLRPTLRRLISNDRRAAMRKYAKAQNLKSYEPMSAEAREKLTTFFKDDVYKLSALLHKDLSHWLHENP